MSVKAAVGWDIHRKFSQVSVVAQGEQGEVRVVKRTRLEHADREAMRQELLKLAPATGGSVVTTAIVDGKPVVVGLNAYMRKDAAEVVKAELA